MTERDDGGRWHPAQVTDPAAWRALAHPLRIALLTELQHRERARATDLAQAVGQPVNAVSFHLRQLVRFGYVTRASAPSGTPDARERWWRTTSPDGFRISDSGADPGRRAAIGVLSEVMRQRYHDLVDDWFAIESDGVDPPTRVDNHEISLDLTDAEIDQLQADLGEVLRRWHQHGRAELAAGRTEGRRAYLRFGLGADRAALQSSAARAGRTAKRTSDRGDAPAP